MRLIIAITALIITATAQDFRNMNWGMSKTQVNNTEKSKPIQETKDILAYKTKIAGLETILIYYFVDDKCTRARYSIIEKHSNKNLFIIDFANLKEKLTALYGEPNDKTHWDNDVFIDDPNNYGIAISAGHLTLYSNWELTKHSIDLMIHGDNYDIQIDLEYSSQELKNLEKDKQNKEALRGL